MNKKRIYLAGRVTGLEEKSTRKKFEMWEHYLEYLGFEVVNPMRIVPEGSNWTDAMRICIHYLSLCNYLALIPGWEISRGARAEYEFAIGMENDGLMKAIIHLQNPEKEPVIISKERVEFELIQTV